MTIDDKNNAKAKKLQALYNTVPNLVWSVLNLTPVSIFCYTSLSLKLLYAFLIISALPLFFPRSFYYKMQLGHTTAPYKKLGVHLVKRISQNGDIVNRIIKKKFPEHKTVTYQKASVNRLLSQTYIYEKFHFMLFVFFILVTVYSLSKHNFGWAVLISLNNVCYNVYPNLLQQYIRVKLTLSGKRLTK